MAANNQRIVVLGSCSVDFTTYAEKLPEPGETLHGYKFATSFGGKGANQCIAASKIGGDAIMVARVGDDKWGYDYIENFKVFGVDTSQVYTTPGRGTGIAQINVSKSGENQIVIVAGANKELSEDDVQKAKDVISAASVLVCQLETPIAATLKAFKLNRNVKILNAAPATPNLDKELLKFTTILCVNESEASLLVENPVNSLSEVACAIKKMLEFGCETVIVTLGKNGAAFATKSNPIALHVAAYKVDTVDTTGAGDAFIGALATLLAMKPDVVLKNAIGSACKIASLSVCKEGTQTSYPSVSYTELLSEEYEANVIQSS